MEHTTMSYAQLLEAYQALQARVSALEGAAAVQPWVPAAGHAEQAMTCPHQTVTGPEACLAGGGEMGAAMRALDWSQTPIGPVASWSPSLRMMVRFLLANRFPLLLWWGPQYVSIYNDAYRPVLGTKHPWALGQPVSTCWSEIWHVLQPLIDTPFHGGPATWMEDLALEINRYGFVEETHFTIAYSPVPDETVPSGIGGVLATVHEISDKVVGERRVAVLKDLGAHASDAKTDEDACAIVAMTLEQHPKDIPFALLYLLEADGQRARLAGAAGVPMGAPASPLVIDLSADTGTSGVWPLAEAVRTAMMQVVDDLAARCDPVPPGPWSAPPRVAAVVPIRSHSARQLAGLLVAGISTRLRFDELYRSFLELVTTQIATAIANARAYEEERQRAEALEELDHAKTAFFSNVSHEFRTPLTLMLGPVEDILAQPEGQVVPEHRDLLTTVHRNGLRLQKLVNTLLDFSRIEAGRVEASYEPTDLATVTADLASVFRSAIERAGLGLVVECLPLPNAVYVDRDMWEKIVLNLLSNAFKFTFAGEIVISLCWGGDHVALRVRDTGTGVPAHELPHLFERFYRIPNARARTYEGTGIGLALVQELVRLHGGEITVVSEVSVGTTFTVTIPTGTAHLPADRVGVAPGLASTTLGAEAFVEEALRWLPDEPAGIPLSVAAVAPPPPGSRPAVSARILLVEDNADMRAYVRRLLSQHWEVVAVADGLKALQVAGERVPDLVLADVMMPGLDGFALLRALRADPRTATLPVILLSARAGEESRVEGLEAGADDYLVKPFSAKELLARVGARLEIARLRREAETALREREEHINRLNAQLRADLASMTRLQRVSTRLVQTRDFAIVLDEILDAAIAITSADIGNIQLLDGDTLKIVAQRGFEAPFLEFFNTVHQGLAACGTAMQRGERIIVEDVATSPLFAGLPACDAMLAAQARAVQSTPLLTRSGRLLGMFSTHYRAPHRPAPRELRLLDLLARQATDCIERAQAEDTVRQRTVQFETLLNAAPLGVYLVDADFRIRQVNPTALQVFGDIPDLIGQDFDEVIHRLWAPAYADEIVRLFRHTLATGEPYVTPEQIEERRDRGVTEYYEWQIHRLPLPDGRYGVVCYFRDISAQVCTRQAIAESEARYRQLTTTLEQHVQERTSLLALIQDVTRAANEATTSAVALQYALDRVCVYTGWPIGHVYRAVAPGADRWAPTALWHLDDPGRFAAFRQATETLELAGSPSLVGQVAASGQPEWLHDVATDPTFQRQQVARAAGLHTGMAWPVLVGSEVAGVLEFYTTEALAPNPTLLEAMVQIGTQLGRTIERERAAAQVLQQQEALLQREKLAAMSTMLANVAHELNNPLASIVLQTELLREDVGQGSLAEPVAEITQAAARCERLVRQFLALARQHPPERTTVTLNTLVAETVEILAYPLRLDNVTVHLHLDDQVPPLWGDPHQLQQVLLNILTNAQHALRAAPGAREITITTQYDPAQHRVTLAVADTGPGIPSALQTRIFEPFFTTKPPGVGTGLGLPLCRGMVEAHGGTLEVSSAPGHGATFRLTLPVGAVPASPSAPPSADEGGAVRGQTILVVDDEVSLANGLARLLRRDGHTVDTVANGRLALAHLDGRVYDLILCDVRMPELDGPSFYRLLERQQPHLCSRLIFLTGDTLEPATQAFLEASGAPCLLKPFAIAEARRIIQRTLQGATPSAPGPRLA
jgi:PAS domain S-box-containing protein